VLTVGVSSVRLPTVRAMAVRTATGGAVPEPSPDRVAIAVEKAWRAEYFPGAGRAGIRRSAIWRVTATFGRNVATPAPCYLVVAPGAAAPDRLDAMRIEAAAAAETSIARPRGRRRSVGEPDWRDPAGWNAWRLPGPGPASRTVAFSLDAAAVDTLGRWLGLFDASGRRLAVARLAEER
jgi:hypothetical protein